MKLKLVEGGPPRQTESVRQLHPLRAAAQGKRRNHAVELLEHWFDDQHSQPDDRWDVALKGWQIWFAKQYPSSPPAEPPATVQPSTWNFESLLTHLTDPATRGDAARGATVYAKAQCAKCHRFGRVGEAIGPDLSTLSRRFQKREVLEAIVYPSHVISDQYASKAVRTTDGKVFNGIVGQAGPDVVNIFLSSGEAVRIRRSNVEQIAPSRISSMPEGLLNELTLQEITDLFEYLYKPEASARSGDGKTQIR